MAHDSRHKSPTFDRMPSWRSSWSAFCIIPHLHKLESNLYSTNMSFHWRHILHSISSFSLRFHLAILDTGLGSRDMNIMHVIHTVYSFSLDTDKSTGKVLWWHWMNVLRISFWRYFDLNNFFSSLNGRPECYLAETKGEANNWDPNLRLTRRQFLPIYHQLQNFYPWKK